MTKPLSERLQTAMDWYEQYGEFPDADFDALKEVIDLARLVEDAATVEITACNQIAGANEFDFGDMMSAAQKHEIGTRVRLVPEVYDGRDQAVVGKGPAGGMKFPV